MSEYDAIISLGGACAPAYNIRRTFRNDRAFPFDWWISSRDGIERVIRDDFAGPYRAENMRLVPSRQTVHDTALNLWYVHDFPRGPDKLILEDFAKHLPERLERYQALASRMDRICKTARVLFVRLEQPGSNPPAGAAAYAAAAKWLSLFREKWPHGSADLLTLNSDPSAPPAAPLSLPAGTALFDNIEELRGDGGWKDRGYHRMFRRQQIVSLAPRREEKLRLNFVHDDRAYANDSGRIPAL